MGPVRGTQESGKPRWCPPGLAGTPQTDLEDLTDLIDIREELSNLVLSAMKEAEDYQDSLEKYSYLWLDDPQEFMRNFLTYGRAVTAEELEGRPEDTIPKSPPTLNQFQEQVCLPAP